MPPRSVKMKRFIFGFQRRVWWPKWTPASSNCFMVTTATPRSFPSVVDTCAAPGGDRGWTRRWVMSFSRIAPAAAKATSVYAAGRVSALPPETAAQEGAVGDDEQRRHQQRQPGRERAPRRHGAGPQRLATRGGEQRRGRDDEVGRAGDR